MRRRIFGMEPGANRKEKRVGRRLVASGLVAAHSAGLELVVVALEVPELGGEVRVAGRALGSVAGTLQVLASAVEEEVATCGDTRDGSMQHVVARCRQLRAAPQRRQALPKSDDEQRKQISRRRATRWETAGRDAAQR